MTRREQIESQLRTIGDTVVDDEVEAELHALEEKIPGFRYIPALSEHDGDDWDGATGLITEVVRENEPALEGMDAYVCGPPPMVDAAIALLTQRGMDEQHIYYDKFTTTGEPEDEG